MDIHIEETWHILFCDYIHMYIYIYKLKVCKTNDMGHSQYIYMNSYSFERTARYTKNQQYKRHKPLNHHADNTFR